MNEDIVIRVKNITKTYRLYDNHADRVRETFHPLRKKYHRPFNALDNISFNVKRGETLGIIGRNGSGKSTLLQIICGILKPTSGIIEVKGRVTALLELGAGFNPEFTGRQNVYINGAIIGLREEEVTAHFDDIAAFANIGEFMDQPIKTYSSGMCVRLAFAVQACLDPDVLVVDEALSVGDFFFQQKCHSRMQALQAHRTAIVLVSHDMTAIEKYSNQVMLLDKGHCIFIGKPNEAVERYYQVEHAFNPEVKPTHSTKASEPCPKMASTDFGTIPDWPPEKAFLDLTGAVFIGQENIAECTGIAVCNNKGQACTTFQIGEAAYFYFEFKMLQDIQVPVGGVVLTNKMNINVHGKNSLQYLLKTPNATKKGTRVRFRQSIHLNLAPGEYSFQVGLASIGAEHYSRVTEMDAGQLNAKLRIILRVRQAGIISVYMRKKGLGFPFYGYADLKGDCALSILS